MRNHFLVDFDHDGDLDLISGNSWGGVHYFENQSYLSVQETQSKAVMDFQLYQNYPNPFNQHTLIKYQLAGKSQAVKLTIFNITGEVIKILVDQTQDSGLYFSIWDGEDDSGNKAASGLYFCRLQAGEFLKTIKLILTR